MPEPCSMQMPAEHEAFAQSMRALAMQLRYARRTRSQRARVTNGCLLVQLATQLA
jgi:hypothetical protein